jgi:PhnB protein
MTVRFQPEGYHSITPYLIVKGGAKAIDFYRRAFGAEEIMRMEDNGRIGHAELKIGDSIIMLADEYLEMGHKSPQTLGGSAIQLLVYVPNVDAAFEQAVKAGAKLKRPVADQFYGDRMGGLEDPFGHEWYLATHVEDVAPEEMKRRMAQAQQAKPQPK